MPKAADPSTPLSIDSICEYVEERVFRLTASEYVEKFPEWPGAIGIEVEMLPQRVSSDHTPSNVPLHRGEQTLAAALEAMAEDRMWRATGLEAASFKQGGGVSSLLALELAERDNLSFEPGGQLEYSSAPYPCLSDAIARMRSVQGDLDQGLEAHGIHLLQVGMNPWQDVTTLGLQMTKSRYQAMNTYLGRIGPSGARMMRQTCTIQVNLDFGRTEDLMVRRFLASQYIAPILGAVFANSPCVDGGRPTGHKSNRIHAWHGLDYLRTGFPLCDATTRCGGRWELARCYADFALSAPVVFVTAADYRVPARDFTLRKWVEEGFEGRYPTLSDLETHLSLLFPEVRPRGFLEIRSVDCQSRVWQTVPLVLAAAVLYDDRALSEALRVFRRPQRDLHQLWVASSQGLSHEDLQRGARALFTLGQDALARLPSCFCPVGEESILEIFADTYTNEYRSPADDYLDCMVSRGASTLTWDIFWEVEQRRAERLTRRRSSGGAITARDGSGRSDRQSGP